MSIEDFTTAERAGARQEGRRSLGAGRLRGAAAGSSSRASCDASDRTSRTRPPRRSRSRRSRAGRDWVVRAEVGRLPLRRVPRRRRGRRCSRRRASRSRATSPRSSRRSRRSRAPRFVLDGEIVIPAGAATSFDDLLQRIHPGEEPRREARRARRRAILIVFDLLAEGDESLVAAPFSDRRARLEAFAARTSPTAARVKLSPSTRDLAAGGGVARGPRRRRSTA